MGGANRIGRQVEIRPVRETTIDPEEIERFDRDEFGRLLAIVTRGSATPQ
jgi:YD repeat-containing protein